MLMHEPEGLNESKVLPHSEPSVKVSHGVAMHKPRVYLYAYVWPTPYWLPLLSASGLNCLRKIASRRNSYGVS